MCVDGERVEMWLELSFARLEIYVIALTFAIPISRLLHMWRIDGSYFRMPMADIFRLQTEANQFAAVFDQLPPEVAQAYIRSYEVSWITSEA